MQNIFKFNLWLLWIIRKDKLFKYPHNCRSSYSNYWPGAQKKRHPYSSNVERLRKNAKTNCVYDGLQYILLYTRYEDDYHLEIVIQNDNPKWDQHHKIKSVSVFKKDFHDLRLTNVELPLRTSRSSNGLIQPSSSHWIFQRTRFSHATFQKPLHWPNYVGNLSS